MMFVRKLSIHIYGILFLMAFQVSCMESIQCHRDPADFPKVLFHKILSSVMTDPVYSEKDCGKAFKDLLEISLVSKKWRRLIWKDDNIFQTLNSALNHFTEQRLIYLQSIFSGEKFDRFSQISNVFLNHLKLTSINALKKENLEKKIDAWSNLFNVLRVFTLGQDKFQNVCTLIQLIQLNNIFVYEGEVSKLGRLKWLSGPRKGCFCEGDWVKNKMHGKGTFIWKNGDVYVGDWADGKRTGEGKLVCAGGNSYEGDWLNNLKHGEGKYIWKNGDVYVGDWADDKRTGKGKFVLVNGDSYEGYFLNGLWHGEGKYIWRNVGVYVGEWENNAITGKGKLVCAGGNSYEGDFLNGLKHGEGKYIWKTGAFYIGDWVNGKRTGKGTLVGCNGDIYIGDFLNNLMHGNGRYIWKHRVFNASSVGEYLGEYLGFWVRPKIYTGKWADGKKNGKGVCVYTDKRRYIGRWVNDEKYGQGRIIMTDGTSHLQVWAHGMEWSSFF